MLRVVLFSIVLLFSSLNSFVAMPQSQPIRSITGKVVCDNKGVDNVVVSDGKTCVYTDKDGRYTIPYLDEYAKFVFISTPSGYLPKDSVGIPQFFIEIDRGEDRSYDFVLHKNPKDDNNHILLVHSDPQFFKEGNFTHYEKVIDDNINTIDSYKGWEVFGIDCGDLVGDNPQYYPKYIEEINRLNVPFYRVLGNHDMNYGGRSDETSTDRYSSIFGPAYYSFNRGKAHYIILDNVFYMGRQYFYIGYITEKMYRWLEQDLKSVDEGSPVFVAMHIPGRLTEETQNFTYSNESMAWQTINISTLFEMLEPYNAHLLTGHMHYNRNIVHRSNLYEHNTAAVCGTWWQGDFCVDGTPIGYGVYEVKGNNVEWYYKSSGHPREYQMRVYKKGSVDGLPEDVVVNVWNWDKNWKVEWFENGISRGEMERFEGFDRDVERMLADKDKLEFTWATAEKTDHLFRVTPQLDNSTVEVVVTDCFGNKYKETISNK